MKTRFLFPTFSSVPALLCTGWLLTAGHGRAAPWVQLKPEMKGSHDAHSGSSSEEVHHRWLEVALSGISLKEDTQVRLEWRFFADDLEGDKIVEQATGTETIQVPAGKTAALKTKDTVFEYVRQHSERQGTGRRARFQLVKASGRRYHGWAVRAFIGSELVGEAFSSRDIATLLAK